MTVNHAANCRFRHLGSFSLKRTHSKNYFAPTQFCLNFVPLTIWLSAKTQYSTLDNFTPPAIQSHKSRNVSPRLIQVAIPKFRWSYFHIKTHLSQYLCLNLSTNQFSGSLWLQILNIPLLSLTVSYDQSFEQCFWLVYLYFERIALKYHC